MTSKIPAASAAELADLHKRGQLYTDPVFVVVVDDDEFPDEPDLSLEEFTPDNYQDYLPSYEEGATPFINTIVDDQGRLTGQGEKAWDQEPPDPQPAWDDGEGV